MNILRIVITSVISLFVLFVLTKIMGNRQVSELTMFDYVIGISIGSIAAEMATDLEKPLYGVVAMIVYALSAVLISFATTKSIRLRRVFFGSSIMLVDNGKINKKALKKAHLDISEFLMQARTAGYFDLSDINFALMEPNGKISFLPYKTKMPVTPEDINITPEESSFCYNVITDGKILYENLKKIGKNKKWLENNLNEQGQKTDNVFLATVDSNDNLKIFSYGDM